MLRQEVEVRALAQTAYEALNSGDLDGFLAVVHEDVEFTSLVAEAEGTTFRGHRGVRAWWDTVYRAFENPQWQLLDFRLSGDGGVIKLRMSGTLSGVDVAQTMCGGPHAPKTARWAGGPSFARRRRRSVPRGCATKDSRASAKSPRAGSRADAPRRGKG
jgi:hypothetical protein